MKNKMVEIENWKTAKKNWKVDSAKKKQFGKMKKFQNLLKGKKSEVWKCEIKKDKKIESKKVENNEKCRKNIWKSDKIINNIELSKLDKVQKWLIMKNKMEVNWKFEKVLKEMKIRQQTRTIWQNEEIKKKYKNKEGTSITH